MKAQLKHLIHIHCLLLAGLVLLPGCGKIIDYGKETFNQAEPLDPHRDMAQNYLLSIAAYDQLSTVAKFDALWLSDQVRKVYSDLHALKNGKTGEQKMIFLRRQIEENYHFITFYVLTAHERPLGVSNGEWTLILQIDGTNYLPIEIKSVELGPEYIYIFGKKYNRFKAAYSVRFDAKDINDQFLIDQNTQAISLHFRTIEKDVVLTWDLAKVMQRVMA